MLNSMRITLLSSTTSIFFVSWDPLQLTHYHLRKINFSIKLPILLTSRKVLMPTYVCIYIFHPQCSFHAKARIRVWPFILGLHPYYLAPFSEEILMLENFLVSEEFPLGLFGLCPLKFWHVQSFNFSSLSEWRYGDAYTMKKDQGKKSRREKSSGHFFDLRKCFQFLWSWRDGLILKNIAMND